MLYVRFAPPTAVTARDVVAVPALESLVATVVLGAAAPLVRVSRAGAAAIAATGHIVAGQ